MILQNRGQHRTRLRLLLWDSAAVTHTSTELNEQLNLSAQHVTALLANGGPARVNPARGEFALTDSSQNSIGTSGEVKIDADDYHSPIMLISGVSPNAGTWREVTEKEYWKVASGSRGYNASRTEEGVFTIIYKPDGVFSIEFSDEFDKGPGHWLKFLWPEGLSPTTLIYTRAVRAIEDGTGHDGDTYRTVPYPYQDWIVHHAAAVIGARSNLSTTQALVAMWAAMERGMMSDSRSAVTPPTTS